MTTREDANMKKRIITLAVAFVAILAGLLSTAAPANAYIDDPYINGRKFASTSVCVGSTLLQSYYRVGYVAQVINNQTQTLALDYSTDCAADGYPPSRRMVVGTYQNAADDRCVAFTNQYHDDYNGFWRWTSGPGIYLNTGLSTCVSTQTRRDHWISQAIAWHLGLNTLDDTNPDEWRLMNTSAWTRDNVGVLTATEGVKLDQIYYGNFCNSGTVC
jgi:hypothetical protein